VEEYQVVKNVNLNPELVKINDLKKEDNWVLLMTHIKEKTEVDMVKFGMIFNALTVEVHSIKNKSTQFYRFASL